MGRPNRYHNDWIFAHYDPNIRWSNLLQNYNETFGTNISYPTFVSYMNRSLKLQQEFCYTDEQEAFLAETYPVFGRNETTRRFNERFGTKRTEAAIGHHCKDILKIPVGEERKKALKREIGQNNYRLKPVGTVSSGLYGTPAVKTENGWIRLDRLSVANGKGTLIVHLDRNKENCNPDNLMVVSRYVHSRMAKYGFWSDNPVINKTAILWCQLDEALSKTGFRKPKAKQRDPSMKKPRKVPEAKSNTGELYIYRTKRKKNPYCVRIDREGFYFNQFFASFERALDVRNMILKGEKDYGYFESKGCV